MSFLDENQDVVLKTMDRLRAIIEDEGSLVRLKLELAAVVEVGKHFVAVTYMYNLDRDGALAFHAIAGCRRVQLMPGEH